jgi:hypothetical protein
MKTRFYKPNCPMLSACLGFSTFATQLKPQLAFMVAIESNAQQYTNGVIPLTKWLAARAQAVAASLLPE